MAQHAKTTEYESIYEYSTQEHQQNKTEETYRISKLWVARKIVGLHHTVLYRITANK